MTKLERKKTLKLTDLIYLIDYTTIKLVLKNEFFSYTDLTNILNHNDAQACSKGTSKCTKLNSISFKTKKNLYKGSKNEFKQC
jgi:hypothetical protein